MIDTTGSALPVEKPQGFMLEKEGESMTLLHWKLLFINTLKRQYPTQIVTYINHTMWGGY